MPEKLRIGIVGAGGIVKSRHLPGFAKVPGVEVVAVSNRSRESAESVAAEWRIPHIVDDWRELVCRDDIDIVLIGTWPYMHRDITAAALAAHKHVFCQARMTMNHADARHMYELSRLTDRVTAICPPPTVMPVDPLVRRMLSEGYLGELRHVRLCSLNAGGADPSVPASWRQIAAYSGLNTMALGIWVEVLHHWCGYCREVSASLRTWVAERPGPAGGAYRVSIPDSVTILCGFENGAQGVIEMSAVTHHAPAERVELYGSEGTIVHEVGQNGVLAGRQGDPGLRFLEGPQDLRGEWNVEANFIAAIRSGAPVQTSFYDGLKYMEFLEAVYRSHQTGAAVRLPLGV